MLVFLQSDRADVFVKSERSFYYGQVPRVSEEHLAARRQQIVDAARVCFARNGFHTTSMQDVIKEAELSVGAVYRYFDSKEALIEAVAEQVVGLIVGELDAMIVAKPLPPLVEVMDRVLRVVEAQTDPNGAARMALQVWGEALRNARLRDLVAGVYQTIRARFVRLAAQAREEGQLPASADPQEAGLVLFGLVPGFLLQLVLVGGVSRSQYVRGVEALLSGTHG
jgi:AcrR family transcriptional regulator